MGECAGPCSSLLCRSSLGPGEQTGKHGLKLGPEEFAGLPAHDALYFKACCLVSIRSARHRSH